MKTPFPLDPASSSSVQVLPLLSSTPPSCRRSRWLPGDRVVQGSVAGAQHHDVRLQLRAVAQQHAATGSEASVGLTGGGPAPRVENGGRHYS